MALCREVGEEGGVYRRDCRPGGELGHSCRVHARTDAGLNTGRWSEAEEQNTGKGNHESVFWVRKREQLKTCRLQSVE